MTIENPDASVDKQMHEWVDGKSIHNVDRNECCPDFSCCMPKLLWSKQRREFFRDHPKARSEMLFQSLDAAINMMGQAGVVYLTGGE